MSFGEKVARVLNTRAIMESSKLLCLADAVVLYARGSVVLTQQKLEKAAQYAWGFERPQGWNDGVQS